MAKRKLPHVEIEGDGPVEGAVATLEPAEAAPMVSPEAIAAAAAPPKRGDLVRQAADLRAGWEADEKAEQEAADRHSWDRYYELLCRADAPKEGDARELAEIMHDFGFTPERVAQDREIIERAHTLLERYQNAPAARAKAVELRALLRQTTAENRRREREIYLQIKSAETAGGHGVTAVGDLQQLALQRPQFFEAHDGVMQPLGYKVVAPIVAMDRTCQNAGPSLPAFARVHYRGRGVALASHSDRTWCGVAAEAIEHKAWGKVRLKSQEILPMLADGPIANGVRVYAADGGMVGTSSTVVVGKESNGEPRTSEACFIGWSKSEATKRGDVVQVEHAKQ